MRQHFLRKPFIILFCLALLSCSNVEIGSFPQSKPTPQLPLTEAENILPSPDGNWTAYFWGYDLNSFRLSVANFDDTIIWNINQENYGSEAMFVPYRWSKDSRYLYFNVNGAIDGYVPFYQGMGLQRLDVLNGEVSEILPIGELFTVFDLTLYDWNVVQFSLSPQEDKLAYTKRMENGVLFSIRDLRTSKENSLIFEQYSNAGKIIWSPNQDFLIIAATSGDKWSNTLSFLELIEVETLESKNILKNITPIIDPLTWVNNHTILVQERNSNYFYFDIMNKELSPAPYFTGFQN